MRLEYEVIQHLSFPDFDVLKMGCDLKERELRILIEGAYLDVSPPRELSDVELVFSDWDSISVRTYHDDWKTVIPNGDAYLKDISEAGFSADEVLLCGFGAQVGWLEWRIINPKMECFVDD